MQACLNLVVQMLSIEQIVHADAHAINLVGIRRSNAATGGTDLVLTQETFRHLIKHTMIRRNNVRTLTHQQSGAVHTAAFQAVDLFEKHFRINNNTVADNRSRGRADDAGGSRCSAYDSSPTTTVWPALLPPLKRAT